MLKQLAFGLLTLAAASGRLRAVSLMRRRRPEFVQTFKARQWAAFQQLLRTMSSFIRL